MPSFGTGTAVRLWLATVACLLGLGLAVVLVSIDEAETWFDEEALKYARAVADAAEAPFQRAMDLGIPLERLRGVESFLAETEEAHGEIDYLALALPDGQVIAAAGTVPPPERLARQSQALLDGGLERSVGETDQSRMVDAAVRLDGPEGTVAVLHVGLDMLQSRGRLHDLYLDTLLLVVAAAALAWELIRHTVDRQLHLPVVTIRAAVQRIGRGEIDTLADAEGRDAVGLLATRLNQRLRRLNAGFYFFTGWLAEVQASQIDDRVRRRIAELARPVLDSIGSPATRSPDAVRPGPADPLRTALYFLVFAEVVLWPFLPDLAAANGGLAGEVAAAAALAAMPLAVVAGIAATGRLAGSGLPPLAALAAVAGHILAATADGATGWLLAGRALAGIGLGGMLGCVLAGAGRVPSGRRRRAPGTATAMLLAAAAAAITADVVGSHLGPGGTAWLAATIALAAAAAALADAAAAGGLPRARRRRRRGTGGELGLVAAAAVLGALALGLLPGELDAEAADPLQRLWLPALPALLAAALAALPLAPAADRAAPRVLLAAGALALAVPAAVEVAGGAAATALVVGIGCAAAALVRGTGGRPLRPVRLAGWTAVAASGGCIVGAGLTPDPTVLSAGCAVLLAAGAVLARPRRG